ncbi:Imm1 family immunity protein [Amycolatopsis sp. cmx-11-51]|uniref:Imm1 family immunity protein n=1 Tax=unclassified Amycolatopsis TaxID=2618356 RepID=UPI0039E55F6A
MRTRCFSHGRSPGPWRVAADGRCRTRGIRRSPRRRRQRRSRVCHTCHSADSPGTVEYDEQAHVRAVPASAEIPVDQVREAVRRFVESGGAGPDNITWLTSSAWRPPSLGSTEGRGPYAHLLTGRSGCTWRWRSCQPSPSR